LVYGPGDLHLLRWFRAIQKGFYRVVGNGQNQLHPLFIDDLLEGLLLMAKQRRAVGRVYHLAGPRPVSIRELAALIGQKSGRRLPERHLPIRMARGVAMLLEALPWIPPAHLPLTRSRIDFMTESRVYSCARAEEELGFKPRIDVDVGLERTIAWYRSEGLL
jgi:nucleoside-diphosphate-sugar epimerase